jgi:hypothetical protein
MRVLYISEVQWLSQVSRKHQLVRRFPDNWDVLFLSPVNARAGENSFRERTDARHPRVRYASARLEYRRRQSAHGDSLQHRTPRTPVEGAVL